MHLMPNVAEDENSIANPVHPTFGPPRIVARKPRVDTVLADAVAMAETALTEIADDDEIGEHRGVTAEDERVVTHRFDAHVEGYRGWEFFVTLARAPRSKVVTVSEIGMLPGEDALLAPDWVPWRDRASEEERIRLDAIAAGEDPVKALEEAGFGPEEIEQEIARPVETPSTEDSKAKAKQARRDAKRRRAKQQAARKKQQKKKSAAQAKQSENSGN